ncbi:MAG: RNA pseudouridine synthase [Bacteroidetes bacterium]|nr:RNA pseudouridine synthase [Bacteroidota bacterium]
MNKASIGDDILFEDNHLLIFNKKPSQIVQGDKTGDAPLSDLLKAFIKIRDHKPGNVFLGVVHRIDRPVSGVVIFAKTSKALTRLNGMIKDGQIRKSYWAVVGNPPPETEGHLIHYLKKNEEKNKSFAYEKEVEGSRKAELIYKVIGHSQRYFLLEVTLLTGRHHQIRSQLSKIGCPIKGDLKYGFDRSNPNGSIHLHARQVEFIHPVSKETIKVVADPPEDPLWSVFLAQNSNNP